MRRYALCMSPSLVSSDLPRVYQLRVLRGISRLIWRHILVRSDTTLAQLHDTLRTAFDRSNEHLHGFRICGKEYGRTCLSGLSFDTDPRHRWLPELCLHQGERPSYVYYFTDRWESKLSPEAILLLDPQR